MFNISSMICHKFLQLPVECGNTSFNRVLNNNVLKIINQAMEHGVLIIIDEIIIVFNITLIYIHLRLCKIFYTTEKGNVWFGRINLLMFGDLLQYLPVNEELPFVPLKKF